jgi:hypothetical protein
MPVDRRNTLLQPGDEVSLPTLERKDANGLNFATSRIHDYLPNAGSIATRTRAAEQRSRHDSSNPESPATGPGARANRDPSSI